MKSFNFFMPTQIRFGTGRINDLKEVLPPVGKRCLVVSRPIQGSQKKTYERINEILENLKSQYQRNLLDIRCTLITYHLSYLIHLLCYQTTCKRYFSKK
jgi:predicted nucleic acid-binding Zn ribbon protein